MTHPSVTVPDVGRIDARLRLDVAAQVATASSRVAFTVERDGHPALDLRQPVDALALDGTGLPPSAFPHLDLGGGPGAEVRVLQPGVGPGRHVLEVASTLATPDAVGAVPVDWRDGGVRFDLWMSDLAPGRYLESWIPAPLCHDRFALTVELEVAGTDRPHTVVANGDVTPVPGGWRIAYPARFTSLSPMLVLAPTDEVEQRRATVALPGRTLSLSTTRHLDVDADLGAAEADIAATLAYLATRYGPWAHGDEMAVFVWGPGRGMEYDGATTAAVGAIEHEVFHSWFGRGVKPASAADGWIDEAVTTWATSSRRRDEPRFACEELPPDADPVVLRPASPWARHTPVESYTAGARLLAGVAWRMGGADRLRSALAALYRSRTGGFVDTDGLRCDLERHADVSLGDLWDRYVHGRG